MQRRRDESAIDSPICIMPCRIEVAIVRRIRKQQRQQTRIKRIETLYFCHFRLFVALKIETNNSKQKTQANVYRFFLTLFSACVCLQPLFLFSQCSFSTNFLLLLHYYSWSPSYEQTRAHLFSRMLI